MTAVSNAGPLIHLAKIGRLNLLKDIFHEIIIPKTVKVEVIDKGKEKGKPDAFLIDAVDWIRVMGDPVNADQLAEKVGIHRGEACAILLAKSLSVPVLLDDSDARKFALGLGLEVVGSVGIIIKAVRLGLISKEDWLKDLEKLANVMWLSVDVYEKARKVIEGL
jgi:predicted nucleic acid-binding protein